MSTTRTMHLLHLQKLQTGKLRDSTRFQGAESLRARGFGCTDTTMANRIMQAPGTAEGRQNRRAESACGVTLQ